MHGRARRPGRELRLDGRARDERDAEPGEDRAAHRLLEAELQGDVEIAQPLAAPAELVLEQLPNAAALLHHDQRLLAQLVERDRPAREAMVGRRGEDDLVAEERLEGDAALPAGRADDAELELAFCDELDDRVRVRDRERHLHTRVLALELAEEHRDNDRGRPRRGAELQRTHELALADRRDVLEQMLLERQHPLRAAVQAPPGLRRLHPAPGAVEQLAPQPLLERPDLQAHGRLRDSEALGGL